MGGLDVYSLENASGHAGPKGQACKSKNVTVHGALSFTGFILKPADTTGDAEAEKLLVLAQS